MKMTMLLPKKLTFTFLRTKVRNIFYLENTEIINLQVDSTSPPSFLGYFSADQFFKFSLETFSEEDAR